MVAALARACVFRPATSFPGSHFNRGTNAAWLGVEWVKDPHPDDEVDALAKDLSRRQIGYIDVFTSYPKPNGQLYLFTEGRQRCDHDLI